MLSGMLTGMLTGWYLRHGRSDGHGRHGHGPHDEGVGTTESRVHPEHDGVLLGHAGEDVVGADGRDELGGFEGEGLRVHRGGVGGAKDQGLGVRLEVRVGWVGLGGRLELEVEASVALPYHPTAIVPCSSLFCPTAALPYRHYTLPIVLPTLSSG